MANILNQLLGSFPNLNSNPALLENALSYAQLSDPSFSSQSLLQLHPLYQTPPPNSLLAKRPSPYDLPNVTEKKQKNSPNTSTIQNMSGYQFSPSQGFENIFPFGSLPQRMPQRNEQEILNATGYLQENAQRAREMGFPENLFGQLGFSGLGNPLANQHKIPTNQDLQNGMLLRPELYSLLDANPSFNSSLFNTQNPFGQIKEPQMQLSPLMLNQLNQASLMGDQRAMNTLLNYQKLQEAQLMEQAALESNFDSKQLQQTLRALQREGHPEYQNSINLLQQQAFALQDPAMLQLLQSEAQASAASLQRDILQRQLQSQAQEKLQQQMSNYNLMQGTPTPNHPIHSYQNNMSLMNMQPNMQGLDQQYMNLLKQQQQRTPNAQINTHNVDNNSHHKRNHPPDLSMLNGLSQRKKTEAKQTAILELNSDHDIQEEYHQTRKISREETKEIIQNQYSEPCSVDRDTGFASGQDNGSYISSSELKRRSEEINESIFSSISDRGLEEELKKAQPKKVIRRKERQVEQSLASVYAQQKTQERRKNRWQIAQEEEKRKEAQRIEEIPSYRSQEVYVQKIVETPIGYTHQARIPLFELDEDDARRRHPKIRWSPETLGEEEWMNLVNKLEVMLRQNIDLGKLIKLLGDNGNSSQKVLNLVQSDPRRYAQIFALKVKKLKFLP